jgi:sugar phosphate isomerase/epimerase
MKLGFWTLGMPPWTTAETAGRARQAGYRGVVLRCSRPENGRPAGGAEVCLATPAEQVDATVESFAAADVEIVSVVYDGPNGHAAPVLDWAPLAADLREHLRLIARLGARRILVPVGRPAMGVSWDAHLNGLWDTVGEALQGEPGIDAMVENHTGVASAEQLLRMAARRGNPRIGVELSPDHCVVMQEDTIALIDEYSEFIHQVCWADRKAVPDKLGQFDGRYYYVRYETCPNGDGLVPTRKIIDALRRNQFDGYVCLKWEKSATFGRQLPTGDVALDQFKSYMGGFGL